MVLAAGLTHGCAPPADPPAPPAALSETPDSSGVHLWEGPSGDPLPFTTDGEVLAFLRDADIVDMKPIPEGVTQSRVVTLEADGVRAHAAFHTHHIVRQNQRLVDGSVIVFFRDSYLNQPAAYEMARLLGMTNVPPTVLREIEGTEGSLQLWVENATTELRRRDEGIEFPDREAAFRQVYDMDIFDALINNRDRSQGNFLWDRSWHLWLIDHTRAFGAEREVIDRHAVRHCSRRLWNRLRALDAAEVERVLAPFMDEPERSALMARRDDLLRLLRVKIDAKGEDEILFDVDESG